MTVSFEAIGAPARQVASLTGETLTEAVRGALRERLRLERIRRGQFDIAARQSMPSWRGSTPSRS